MISYGIVMLINYTNTMEMKLRNNINSCGSYFTVSPWPIFLVSKQCTNCFDKHQPFNNRINVTVRNLIFLLGNYFKNVKILDAFQFSRATRYRILIDKIKTWKVSLRMFSHEVLYHRAPSHRCYMREMVCGRLTTCKHRVVRWVESQGATEYNAIHWAPINTVFHFIRFRRNLFYFIKKKYFETYKSLSFKTVFLFSFDLLYYNMSLCLLSQAYSTNKFCGYCSKLINEFCEVQIFILKLCQREYAQDSL